MRFLSIGLVVLLVVGCTGAATEHSVGPLPNGSFASCPDEGVLQHADPELEALLPKTVNGRELTIWSVSGWCWVDMAYPSDAAFARAASGIDEEGVRAGDLAMAVAGRSDTQQDPPYFVFAVRGSDQNTNAVAIVLLFGGLGADPAELAADANWEAKVVGGKDVQVGAETLVEQSEHQKGRPYVYETDDYLYVVLSDREEWAADALHQLQ